MSYRVSKEELAIKRVESLIERRDILLNSCLLRQMPHSVELWDERLDILQKDEAAYVRTFHECLTSVDPFKADGRLSSLWTRFADHFEASFDIAAANQVYWKAACSVLKSTDEYVALWVAWIEMLLRVGAYEDALDLAKYPLTQTLANKKHNLVYSNRLWSLLLDLELNFGNRDTVRDCYQKMIDLTVVTPYNLLNFAKYLIDQSVSEV
jgi:pre-mRNA-splicing factor SYF1